MNPILAQHHRPASGAGNLDPTSSARPGGGTEVRHRRSGLARSLWQAIACLPLVVGITACSGPGIQPPIAEAPEPVAACLALYRQLDSAAQGAGVIDAAAQRLDGAAYLRTNRFLASFDPAHLDDAGYRSWLRRHNQLANTGLTKEWRRLPEAYRQGIGQRWTAETLPQTLSDCGEQLVAYLLEQPRLPAIEADHDYQLWQRWLGVYPLTGLAFRWGVVREHRDIARSQARQQARIEQGEGLADWALFHTGDQPTSPTRALRQMAAAPRDGLGIPLLDDALQHRLLAAMMPAFALQHTGGALEDNDYPGQLQVDSRGDFRLLPDRPTVYTHISYGRYRDQVTVQLNYSVWFSERRPEGSLDLLAGRYNGVTWRVHLLPEGTVLGYDKTHQCGCWYQFYPAMGFRARPDLPFTQEPVYIGDTLDPRVRHTLWLEANTHMLLAISPRQPAGERQTLEVRPYRELRALRDQDGQYHSLFDHRGLIPSSVRPERYLFWPMGIASAGALRIHGRHAIAFIGRRHFDDPRLLEELRLH